MLRIGSFRRLRRLVACYCIPSSYLETLTPRHLRGANLATLRLEFLHPSTSVGDLVLTQTSRGRAAVGHPFRTIPARARWGRGHGVPTSCTSTLIGWKSEPA